MRILLEEGTTAPIYWRIATAFAQAFQTLGHEIIFIDTTGADRDTYAKTINDASIDYYVITNDSCFVYERTSRETFIFEEIETVKLFVHHDASLTSPVRDSSERQFTDLKLAALQRCAHSSQHFCIELATLRQLQKLGILNSFEFFHASEFTRKSTGDATEDKYGISFVGHLMSSMVEYPLESLELSHHMTSLAYQRLTRSSVELQPLLEDLADCKFIREAEFAQNVSSAAVFQYLLHELTKLTMPYRGELIRFIAKHRTVDIIGGDLSYGSTNHPLLKIKHDNVRYHSATLDYREARSIYAASTVNVNISSLQFDSAMNNRVFDVLFSGGFLITDRRGQIARLMPELQPFTFDTPEEMVALALKYSEPSFSTMRVEFTKFLYEKYSNIFSYQVAARYLLEAAKLPRVSLEPISTIDVTEQSKH
jgi:hypothetical protein